MLWCRVMIGLIVTRFGSSSPAGAITLIHTLPHEGILETAKLTFIIPDWEDVSGLFYQILRKSFYDSDFD